MSPDDGLPQNICALCISYLKHATTFRKQAVNTCLNFLAVKEYKNLTNDKKECNNEKLIDNNTTTTSAQRNYDDDNLKNNQSKEQNKVSKTLMSHTSFITTDKISKQVKLSLKYLSELYDKNLNSEANTCNLNKSSNEAYKPMGAKQRRYYNKSFDAIKSSTNACNSQRQNLEDDFPRTTSSDEYETTEEARTRYFKNNIFSYKEKNFQEDDIMDLDELKNSITINIPSTCQEHKCSHCFKRFMFEESFGDHIKTCIEYKFSTFVEEINNLIHIRSAKEISPHEFIRRMIFTLRKTCEWLKDNCIDASLPDLLQNNQTNDTIISKQRLESDSKSTISSTDDQLASKIDHRVLNKTVLATSPLIAAMPTIEHHTPINISNNILYEIERSESRNSQKLKLKKPIPILGTANAIKTASNLLTENESKTSPSADSKRLPFIEKSPNLLTSSNDLTLPKSVDELKTNIPSTPLINVRRDLLPPSTYPSTEISFNHTSPLLNLLQSPHLSNSTPPVPSPCARCPQCNLYFKTLNALEVHNAMQHNSITCTSQAPVQRGEDEMDLEHKRIIALFENDDEI